MLNRAITGTSAAILLFLAMGCANDNNDHAAEPAKLVLGETVVYPENEPPFIHIIDGDGEEVISDIEQYPSLPVISPNGERMAYISPYEFEMKGNVWLYDITHKLSEQVIFLDGKLRDDETPKKLKWLNDERLLILTGNTFGTVSSNRNLYVYNDQKQCLPVVQVKDNEDIRSITVHEDNVVLEVAVYTDDEQDEYVLESVTYDIQKFLMTIVATTS